MWRRFIDILNFGTHSCVGLRKSRRSTHVVKDIAPILVLRNHLVGVFNGLDDLEFTHRRFSRSELIGYPEMLAFIGDSVVKDVGGFGVVLKQVSLLVFADVIVPPSPR